MKNKIFFGFINLILLFAFLYIAGVNFFAKTTSIFTLTLDKDSYSVISTFVLISVSFGIGAFAGILYSFGLWQRLREQLEFYARKNEKLSQQNEIDTDDKETLQRKIATLEIALENALKKGN